MVQEAIAERGSAIRPIYGGFIEVIHEGSKPFENVVRREGRESYPKDFTSFWSILQFDGRKVAYNSETKSEMMRKGNHANHKNHSTEFYFIVVAGYLRGWEGNSLFVETIPEADKKRIETKLLKGKGNVSFW